MSCHLAMKPGVRLHGLRAEMVVAIEVVRGVFEEHGVALCVITAASDGTHQQLGGHYQGDALDFRTTSLTGPPREDPLALVASLLRGRLGPDFFVLMEGVNTPNEHLHVEWRPGKLVM